MVAVATSEIQRGAAAATAEQDEGVCFRSVDGRVSSTAAGRGILSDAVRSIDAELAAGIEGERDWRKRYVDWLPRVVSAGARGREQELRICRDGLDSVGRRFAFRRGDEERPVAQVVRERTGPELGTLTVEGAAAPVRELSVPFEGRDLRGDELRAALAGWVEHGLVEPSFAEAIGLVIDNPDWLDLSDRTVVLLGACAEMGPLEALCEWGAEVAAVDLPRQDLWERIEATARAGAGRVHAPVAPDGGRAAGADLLTEAGAVRAWLDTLDRPLVLANHLYADGATGVRLTVAADALVADAMAEHDDAVLAYMATPTDVFAVPPDVVEGARGRRLPAATRAVRGSLRSLSLGRMYVPNYRETVTCDGDRELGVSDCLIAQQGPNYALAKRIQLWRAELARSEGALVSANVAPASRTRSVLKNRLLAAAYAGAPPFGVSSFPPAASRRLMAAMLMHDLRNPRCLAQPGHEPAHPMDLLAESAAHAGLWRLPYTLRSAMGAAVLIGLPRAGRLNGD